MSVLVWIEQVQGSPLANSWEVLGAGRKLADSLGAPLVAAVIGSDTAATAEAARTYGADTVLTLTSPALANSSPIHCLAARASNAAISSAPMGKLKRSPLFNTTLTS